MPASRLNEFRAETDQVAFIGCRETGAAPVLEEAFVREENGIERLFHIETRAR